MSAHFSGFLSPSAWHARWGLGRRFERRQGVRPTVDRLHRVGLVDGSALYVLSFRSGWVARNPGNPTSASRSHIDHIPLFKTRDAEEGLAGSHEQGERPTSVGSATGS